MRKQESGGEIPSRVYYKMPPACENNIIDVKNMLNNKRTFKKLRNTRQLQRKGTRSHGMTLQRNIYLLQMCIGKAGECLVLQCKFTQLI